MMFGDQVWPADGCCDGATGGLGEAIATALPKRARASVPSRGGKRL